jgi:hypothetical protein
MNFSYVLTDLQAMIVCCGLLCRRWTHFGLLCKESRYIYVADPELGTRNTFYWILEGTWLRDVSALITPPSYYWHTPCYLARILPLRGKKSRESRSIYVADPELGSENQLGTHGFIGFRWHVSFGLVVVDNATLLLLLAHTIIKPATRGV